MSVEIEKKYRLNESQKKSVTDSLNELGAEFVGTDFEENTIYGGGILDTNSAILRIRKTLQKTLLTYKQRFRDDLAVKHQTEYETLIGEADELEKMLEALGFKPRLVYEKRRQTWKFRSVEIVFDELPFGEFMEIEGSVTGIAEAEMFLEAEEFEVVHESYPALTWQLGVRNGNLIEARFADKNWKNPR